MITVFFNFVYFYNYMSFLKYKTYLYVKAGKGGASFNKDVEVKPGKIIPILKPGGRGGDIRFLVNKNVRGFSHLNIHKIEGKPGMRGDQKKSGSCGKTIVILIPINTHIKMPHESIFLTKDKESYVIPGQSGMDSGHNVPRFIGHVTLQLTNKKVLGCNLTSYGCKYQQGFYTAMGKKEVFIEDNYNFKIGKKIFCCLGLKASFNLLKNKKLRNSVIFLLDHTSPDISHLINNGIKHYICRDESSISNLKKLIQFRL